MDMTAQARDADHVAKEELLPVERVGRSQRLARPAWDVASTVSQDTTSPFSVASDDTEVGTADVSTYSGPVVAPVKNTFIHFGSGEQPDYRSCISGPAFLRQQPRDEFEETPSSTQCTSPGDQATSRQIKTPVVAKEFASYGTHIKNTFIHFDVEEGEEEESDQPDYRPTRSGPARCFAAPEEDFGELDVTGMDSIRSQPGLDMVRRDSLFSQGPDVTPVDSLMSRGLDMVRRDSLCSQGPDVTPVDSLMSRVESDVTTVDSLRSRDLDMTPVCSMQADDNTTDLHSLPSAGSAFHSAGKCKPCAHNWKPGGCSKGVDCTFCHLCEEGDFRRRRREKLQRMKAERAMRKKVHQSSGDAEDDSDDSGELEDISTKHSGSRRPSASTEADEECSSHHAWGPGDDLTPGEVAVTYNGDQAIVQWAVDLRKFCLQHRCGEARRFSVRFRGIEGEVPFVFFISPASADTVEASSTPGHSKLKSLKRPQVNATMQLKCADASALAEGGLLLNVGFAAGSLAPRRASPGHNFAMLPVCKLPVHQASWDLSVASQGGTRCVLRAELEPAGPACEGGAK